MTAPDAAQAGWLYAALGMRGVLVRLCDKPSLDSKLRIVGAPEENAALLAAQSSSIRMAVHASADDTSGDAERAANRCST